MGCLTGNKPRSTARSFIPYIDAYRGHSFDVKDGVPFLVMDCAPIDFAGEGPNDLARGGVGSDDSPRHIFFGCHQASYRRTSCPLQT